VLCGRDVLYLHTQLCVSSNSSSVNAVAAALMFPLSSSSLVTVIHMYYSRFRINICRNFWGYWVA